MTNARANRGPLVRPGEIDHHLADMTATFSADVTLAAAEQKLAAAGQWLPIDGAPESTIGKLVEINSTGPLRLGYGAWRDLLLGAQFLNGCNELVTAGGRTVKNVAGYDLTKFMVGQCGIFGKLVSLTTRTYKRPAAAALARFAPDIRLVNRIMPTELRPQWMMLTAGELLCGYVSDERTVDWYVAKLPEIKPVSIAKHTIEEELSIRRGLWKVNGENWFRAAVAPARVKEFVDLAGMKKWVADPAFGVVMGEFSEAQEARIRDAGKALSATVTFWKNDRMDFETADDGQRQLLERLKKSFDPDGKLVPLPWQRSS